MQRGDLHASGPCKALPAERGSAPPRRCLANGTSLDDSAHHSADDSAAVKPVNERLFQIEEGTAFRFAIAALAALFA
jgi:hypothetical protein